jgi:hypothetical protein
MRAIALVTHAPAAFSVEGTATVILAGAASGAGGGLVYAILYRLLPHARLARAALFGVVLLLLTLRGLRPVQPLSLAAFMPLVLLYGTAIEVAWRRRVAGARSAEAAA